MSTSQKFLIAYEDYTDTMGYTVKQETNGIYATFWVFTDNDEEILEKHVRFHSLRHLYDASKLFVQSDLVDYSLLHQSQCKMMRDFIAYYDKVGQGDKPIWIGNALGVPVVIGAD